jgi:hypothetical protein
MVARRMEPDRVLAAFDAEVRRSARPDGSGVRIEVDPLVVRWVGTDGRGWSGIAWSGLDDARADAVIAGQVGLRLLPVTDEAGVGLLTDVHERVFGARLAAARGYRYLYVDASPDSQPILARLGFSRLARTTPYVWDPRAQS